MFLFHRCLKEIDQPYLQRQLVEKALHEKKDLSALLDRMDLDSWKICISVIINETPYVEDPYLWEAREVLFTKYPLQGLCLEKLLWERVLSRGFLMKEELLKALGKYCQCIRAFYKGQYQETMFEEKSRYLLPSDCRMALTVQDALEHWTQGKLTETVRLFRQALKIYPQITGIIREVLRLLKNETAGPPQTAGAEFEQLAVQMKAALNGMVQRGQYKEAMSVLSQLLPLLPNDMELLKLWQLLLSRTC